MPEFVLHINAEGKIINKSKVKQVFSDLRQGKYLVRIDQFKKRSLQQNAYYFGVVVPLVKEGLRHAGYNEVRTNEDAHEVLKHLFLKKKIVNQNTDEVIEVAGSTSKLKTVEFNTYLEQIWQWSEEYLNVKIPLPNEQLVLLAEYDAETKATIIH